MINITGDILICHATPEQAPAVSSVLSEVAEWLLAKDQPLWQLADLTPQAIAPDIAAGQYYLALIDGSPAGVLRFQLEDETVWPDVPAGEAAYIHKVAIRRKYAGSGISRAMIEWAKTHTRDIGRAYLRLDCAPRPRLCTFYESNGFSVHSKSQIGPYPIVRFECKVI